MNIDNLFRQYYNLKDTVTAEEEEINSQIIEYTEKLSQLRRKRYNLQRSKWVESIIRPIADEVSKAVKEPVRIINGGVYADIVSLQYDHGNKRYKLILCPNFNKQQLQYISNEPIDENDPELGYKYIKLPEDVNDIVKLFEDQLLTLEVNRPW